jgi:5-methylthioadenosine/S-adenosylhomocysteine deaminase
VIITADLVYAEGRLYEQAGIEVDAKGMITRLHETAPAGPEVVQLAGRALIPGTVNAHNHSFQSLLRGFGDDLSFLEWRERALYRYSPRLGQEGVATGALLAFGEMLLSGVTTVCDFFYLQDGGNENARAVIEAARSLGIRIVMARCFYDWEGAPASYRETPDEATERFTELHRAYASDPLVRVQPAPHSLHGASEAMIRAGVQAAAAADTPYHIHLAEERYQVDEALARYGVRPLFALERMGVLGERTIAIHGCWFDESERALLAERRGALVYNPNSNMFLGDGVTDIVDLAKRRVRLALGTDGGCSNSRVSVLDEMRACALLQKVHRLDGQAITAETCFEMGTKATAPTSARSISEIHPSGRYSAFQRTWSTPFRRAPSPM